ncbi:hypothetical protein [Algihabitans albus]|uniref:hypothetical protein n=1 Tax=Algihabitans albus TaxID=2164067 RepID=UPI0013C30A8B|nr:hypothetical protein [Algihabitans albus]
MPQPSEATIPSGGLRDRDHERSSGSTTAAAGLHLYRVDPENPNEVLLRDARGRLLETIEVRLIYPLGVARRPGEVCEGEKRTAEKIAAALNTDYRALQVALLHERAQVHRGEAMTLECGPGFLSAEQRAAIDWHERQARALHHEAELIDKAPRV